MLHLCCKFRNIYYAILCKVGFEAQNYIFNVFVLFCFVYMDFFEITVAVNVFFTLASVRLHSMHE